MALKKITLPELANLLALESGESSELCLNFLRSFLKHVAESLENGETNIKIKGFGEFRIVDVGKRMSVDVSSGEEIEIPPHQKVVFIPSKRLAALVNAPFSMFEAVEVNENVDESELSDDQLTVSSDADNSLNVDQDIPQDDTEKDQANDTEPDIDELRSESIQEEITEEEAEPSASAGENIKCTENLGITDSEEPNIEDSDVQSITVSDELSIDSSSDIAGDDQKKEHKSERGYRFLWGFFSGFITAIVVLAICAGIYLTLNPNVLSKILLPGQEMMVEIPEEQEKVEKQVESNISPEVSDADTESAGIKEDSSEMNGSENLLPENAVDTKPSDQKKIDTITKTRYLTTMARDHYGNYNLWPYIYIENQSILGHPDRIRPGTEVVIPPLSKYGVDPKSEKDIKEAKRKGVEIYARYK